MGLWRLVTRRLLVHPVALVAVVTAVLMSMSVVTTLHLLSQDIEDASVRTSLDVPEVARTVEVSAYLRPPEVAAADAVIRAGLTEALGSAPITRAAILTTRGIEGRAATDRAQVAELDGLARSATLTAGGWPVPATVDGMAGREPVEVAVPETAARELGLSVGSRLALTNLIDEAKPALTVTVAGTYAPMDPEAALWADDTLSVQGVIRTEFTTIGPFVLGTGSLAHADDGAFTMTWRAPAGIPGDRDALARSRGQISAGMAALARAIGAGGGSQKSKEASATHLLRNATVTDHAQPLFDAAAAVAERVRVALLTPTLLLLLLGSVALVVAAGLLASLRSAETSLLRIRGAGGGQLAALAATDAALLVLAGTIGAALAAPVLARWIGTRSGLPVTGGTWGEVMSRGSVWVVLAGMGLLAVLVIVLTTLGAVRRPASPGRSGRSGRAGRGLRALTGSGLDVLLVLLGVLGVVQLRRYAAAPGATIDPLTVAAPVLVLASLAVLCLRLLPVLVRVAARTTESRPGLDLAWGGWQVARRLTDQSGTILLVLLAMAMGSLAMAHGTTTARAIEDQANFRSGSALRVDASSVMLGDPGLGASLAETAGGDTRVMPAHRETVDLGPLTDVTILGIDAAVAGPILTPRPDTLGDRPWRELAGTLADARDLGDGLSLPGHPTELDVALDLTSTTPVPDWFRFPAQVHLRDRRGLVHSIALGDLPLGSSTPRVSLPVGAHALADPLTLVGVVVSAPTAGQWVMQAEALRLRVTAVSSDGTAVPGVDTLTSQGTSSTIARMASPAREPVAALVTQEVATATRARIGSTVSVPTTSGPVVAKVVAVIESFPTARTPTRAIVLDLPSTMAASHGAGRGGRAVTLPAVQEWWLDPVDPGATAARLAPELAPGSAVTLRSALVAERMANPVNAGLRSAMALVTAAALVLAAVGFAATTVALSRTRRHENAILHALGIPSSRIRRTLILERLALVVVTVVTGLGLGVVAAHAVVPLIVSGDGHPQVPRVLVSFAWPALLALTGGALAVLSAVGVLVLRGAGRDVAQELREGLE